jgi:hypothetical protein
MPLHFAPAAVPTAAVRDGLSGDLARRFICISRFSCVQSLASTRALASVIARPGSTHG